MLKKNIITSLLLLSSISLLAQDSNSVFQFLKLPVSAHAAGLGGKNISIVEDDLTMAFQNPALLSCVADNTLNLNYMYYIEGVNTASAAFSRMLGDRAAWAVAAQYVDYGSMKEVTEENIVLGTFKAKDMLFAGFFSYDFNDYWSGGVRTNLIYSNYADRNSFAIGVDLGLNYYHEYSDFSFSVAANNLGGQIVAFEDRHEKLPVDLMIGASKRLAHAPFRASLTFYNINRWKHSKFLDHFALGLDFIPTSSFYASLGYNFQRGSEMKIAGASKWAGLTAGVGIHVKRFKFGAAYAKYHAHAKSCFPVRMNLT